MECPMQGQTRQDLLETLLDQLSTMPSWAAQASVGAIRSVRDLKSPIGPPYTSGKPAVFANERVYHLSPKAEGNHFLIDENGTRRNLRQSATYDIVHRDSRRRNILPFRRLIQQAAGQKQQQFELVYFTRFLGPVMRRRDFESIHPNDSTFQLLDELADRLPALKIPHQALLTGGEFHLLDDGDDREKCDVFCGGRAMRLNGESIPQKMVEREWRRAAQQEIDKAKQVIAEILADSNDQELKKQRHRLKRYGHLKSGDLVLLKGAHSWLGCILNKHFNLSLSAMCDRDICIAVPLRVPANRLESLRIFRKRSKRWAMLPHNPPICASRLRRAELGESGLSLAGTLREAATHFAMNRRFHS